MNDLRSDFTTATAKSGPPILAFWSGLTLNDLVGWMTLAYLALQAAHLLWKWQREIRGPATRQAR
ncbi:hypothetical protein D0B54_02400 [Solimonas sp. K1W22B-7]|uniref:hypothetical protein n=1 Tax=Solimonas sp. K1W22B-7 TaxID=2303331 RepID=UPI000E32F041|nr:hypothetical protein [Solimonas sp. K1W22B-7]AXQ27592.1 hypothetical protein D0B54_02400 [Solimonas sp. K1W22B-7]